ncbi:hypothetical protein [Sulfidibacter corallicola]|uniref:Uncharacterized protein n=1 Tax=Sulfidibacter corallicola TaxID=2818388 RepID=A0A8A4TW06_SULCO|nr:hypothetical protein [Sulfidibacter corallicola]QTD53351.1 hypothetical protein J3U87_12925 [Sulfidibacter corallicola]
MTPAPRSVRASVFRLLGRNPLRRAALFLILGVVAGLPSMALPKSTLLVLGPDAKGYKQVMQGMSEELEDEFDLIHRKVDRDTPYKNFEAHLLEVQPDLLVLMDNVTISYYRFFQERYRGRIDFPPTIVTMALFVDQSIKGMEKVIGLRYEVPPVISLTHLRSIIADPVNRVGVVYRAEHRNYFEGQKAYCDQEKITLVGYEIGSDGADGTGTVDEKNLSKEIRNGLKYLITNENVDVLLVLNDNKLLREKDVRTVWLPKLRRFRKPVVVGVESLMSIAGFGNFGVLPDHYGLGISVANLAIDIKESQWEMESGHVYNPNSVKKHLEKKFARKYLTVPPDKYNEIDILK